MTTAASDDASLVEGATEEAPDAVVLDARMPLTFTDEGIRTALELRARCPGMPVLVLATDAVTSRAATLLDLDARGMGCLVRDPVDGVGSLLDALEWLRRGEPVVDPEIIGALLARERGSRVMARLTFREREVLQPMAEGHSNAGIGRALFLSTKTVEAKIAAICHSSTCRTAPTRTAGCSPSSPRCVTGDR